MVGGQPLTRVRFVRFSDPNDPDTVFGQNDLFELMAVSLNTWLVPEPATGTMVAIGLMLAATRSRVRRRT